MATRRTQLTVLRGGRRKWDVLEPTLLAASGKVVPKRVGRVEASSKAEAQRIARARYGSAVTVRPMA